MALAERSDVAKAIQEDECTHLAGDETARGAPDLLHEFRSRHRLKEVTNCSGGGLRKRSSGSLGVRSKPSQLKSSLRDFFYESKVHAPDGGKKEDNDLVDAAREEGIDACCELNGDEMVASGSVERKEEENQQGYTRLFTAQSEHHTVRTLRRTQSQFDELPGSRKRPSLDGDDKMHDEAPERKRSCAITLNDDSTVDVEPGDDDVFEGSADCAARALPPLLPLPLPVSSMMADKEGSPMSEYGPAGHAVMHHRANFERTLSASVLERGEFAPPLRDHPHLPALPNIVYQLPLVPPKQCQVHSVAFGCISAHTLAAEMQSLGLDQFHRKYVLIDCRYPYEYKGGHIRNAINLHDNTGLPALFYPPTKLLLDGLYEEAEEEGEGSTSSSGGGEGDEKEKKKSEEKEEAAVPPVHLRIPIFYCEYSQKRGPTMAHDLRSIDRRRNIDRYPGIDYDVMYVLERGYRNFFQTFGESNAELFSAHCGYVEMKQEMKQLGQFKAHRKRAHAHRVKQAEAASEMSPSTPAPPGKEGRRASIVARARIRETLGLRLHGAKTRLAFDSEEENSPVKKRDGAREPCDL